MSARTPAPKFTAPLPPEPPSEPGATDHLGISTAADWEDERVLDADLAGEVADRVRWSRCELHRVVLTGAQLRGLALVDVLAIDCELSGAYLHEASLQRVELRNCRMTGVVMTQSSLSHVRLVDCKLDEANLRLARADHVEMIGCSMVDADLYEAEFTKSALEDCDLRMCNFTKTSVPGLRLSGSRLDGVRGAMSMGGVVITGDQVLTLALSLMSDLHIEVDNDDV
jgi:uncharacterized protein YjbI with pentapeptide repeats